MPDASDIMTTTEIAWADDDEHTLTTPSNARALWLFAPTGNAPISFRTEPGGTAILLPLGIWTKMEDLNIAGRDWSYEFDGGGGGDVLHYVYLLGKGD